MAQQPKEGLRDPVNDPDYRPRQEDPTGSERSNLFGPIDLHMWEDPDSVQRAQIAVDKVSAEVRTEWDAFPWYKKAWIRLWPSLYPEWHF